MAHYHEFDFLTTSTLIVEFIPHYWDDSGRTVQTSLICGTLSHYFRLTGLNLAGEGVMPPERCT